LTQTTSSETAPPTHSLEGNSSRGVSHFALEAIQFSQTRSFVSR
jgi:hypothetical protein